MFLFMKRETAMTIGWSLPLSDFSKCSKFKAYQAYASSELGEFNLQKKETNERKQTNKQIGRKRNKK